MCWKCCIFCGTRRYRSDPENYQEDTPENLERTTRSDPENNQEDTPENLERITSAESTKTGLRQEATELSKLFRTTANELDRSVSICNGVTDCGRFTTAAGMFATCAGIALASGSGGISLATLGLFTGMTVAGRAASTGSQLAAEEVQRTRLCDMKKRWEAFTGKMNALANPTSAEEEIIKNVEKVLDRGYVGSMRLKKIRDVHRSYRRNGFTKELQAQVQEAIEFDGAMFSAMTLSFCELMELMTKPARSGESSAGKSLRRLADELDSMFA